MRKWLQYGGIAAAVVLIAFGIGALVLSIQGKNTVTDSLSQEHIVGTPDMTPSAIKDEGTKAGLNPHTVDYPSCTVANKPVDTASEARCFAEYMRIHALEATHGLVYAQMGIYLAKPGTPQAQLTKDGATDNVQYAQIDPKTQQPVQNGARQVWVTETALTTALNTSYMAQQMANFGIVVGIALLLSGFGFGILAVGGALRAGGWVFASEEKEAVAKTTAPIGA